ncbi:hypothetical protein ACFQ21_00800 [Ohtaekwangia kribbensis]|jgi:hypothetical protein|uniref:Uncharacterized protein n=1 Tax=Ohtaekwangia kribbensis TaxID=688913 RepID=A0ABW3JX95_9BACT
MYTHMMSVVIILQEFCSGNNIHHTFTLPAILAFSLKSDMQLYRYTLSH